MLLETRKPSAQEPYWLSLNNLTSIQYSIIKSLLVDMDNKFNKVFPSFFLLNPEFLPRNRLIDIFSNCFSFHLVDRDNDQNIKSHIRKLDNITIQASLDPYSAVIVSDASIKNQVTTSISHIHSHNNPVIKTKHHAIRVMSSEAELFAIRCCINQATYLPNVNQIIIITDSIHTTKKIFDSSEHPYQLQSMIISQDLREFFKKSNNHLIEFWDFPSQWWHLHNLVNKEAGKFNLSPIFSCKLSWDYNRKTECTDILNFWGMTFQASDDRGCNFLDLVDEDSNLLELSIANGSLWLKHFGHSNSLCARATRVIVNHAPIGEYRLRFFPREDIMCPCGEYPIETRHHILHECKRYNNYWNPWRDSIGHFVLFLEFNGNVFSFTESIT